MKKIVIILLLMHTAAVHAQSRVLEMANHPPVLRMYMGTLALCNAEMFMMSINPESSKIKEYEACVDEKKAEAGNMYIEANKYLKSKGYTDAMVSLRRYYNAILQRLSEGPIYVRESSYEQGIRERRADEAKRAQDVALDSLMIDIKMAE